MGPDGKQLENNLCDPQLTSLRIQEPVRGSDEAISRAQSDRKQKLFFCNWEAKYEASASVSG